MCSKLGDAHTPLDGRQITKTRDLMVNALSRNQARLVVITATLLRGLSRFGQYLALIGYLFFKELPGR